MGKQSRQRMTGLGEQQRVAESQEKRKLQEERRKKLAAEVARETARTLLDTRRRLHKAI